MPLKSKMTKKEEQALLQKATEAMQLFADNPNVLRGFLNALKKGDFSGGRGLLNVSPDLQGERTAAERQNVDSSTPKS